MALGEIALIAAEGNYSRLHFGANRPLLRTSLQAVEERLDPTLFFRASRSHLVNLRFVDAAEGGVDDGLIVRLRTGHSVQVSRRQARRLRERLSL